MDVERHLINEIHDELDWATSEVARCQGEVVSLETEYHTRIETEASGQTAVIDKLNNEKVQRILSLEIGQLYKLQSRAAQRYARLSRVYEIGCTQPDIETIANDLMTYLFRAADHFELIEGSKASLTRLATALYAYFRGAFSDETDQEIRDAWMEIEGIIAGLGRTS